MGSKLSKMMINEAKIKAVMDTGVDKYLVNRGVELIGEWFN